MRDGQHLKRIDLAPDHHPTAVIHPRARIGKRVTIGPFSIIGEDVSIGDGCVVGPRVLIEGHTTIGRNNVFLHGATVGMPPQDLKYSGAPTRVEIGDGNTFREFVTVNRGSGEDGVTGVGSGCFLMAYAHVGHDCAVGNEVIMANAVNLGGHVRIDDYVNIGGGTSIHQFCSVGKYAFVGGGSRVDRDVPPFVKAAGTPLRVYGVNSVGLERRGFPPEKRAMIKSMYKLLYRSGLNVSQVVEHLRNGGRYEDPERTLLVDFLTGARRGITR